jgi:catechol 2,3-dioxygenase-like lactoylglutathione lyase family enzyme
MNRPEILGIHHLKLNVADLARSLMFYEQALGARRVAALDHRWPSGELFAYVLTVEGLGTHLELRLSPELAERERGLDIITLAVRGREDLLRWDAHLTSFDVAHSPVLTGLIGWLLVMEDPDGRRIRFYTQERHGPELLPSRDPHWLGA